MDFSEWLKSKNTPLKVIRDHKSRLNRLRRVFKKIYGDKFSFEKEFEKDECKTLLSLLRCLGKNPDLEQYYPVDLPIGKTTIGCIRFSLRTYINYLQAKTV